VTSPVADGATRSLDPRHIPYSRALGGWTLLFAGPAILGASIIVAVVVGLPLFLRLAIPAAGLVIVAAWGALVWWWPVLEHRHASYRVTEDDIEIRGGVLWRRITAVARSRVQHTDVAQGPLERNFGLARLHIYTAGTDHAKVTLVGLDHATALAVRDHLLATTHDDAV
jgi:membrane protein YdbS with pleckstrin-like domain